MQKVDHSWLSKDLSGISTINHWSGKTEIKENGKIPISSQQTKIKLNIISLIELCTIIYLLANWSTCNNSWWNSEDIWIKIFNDWSVKCIVPSQLWCEVHADDPSGHCSFPTPREPEKNLLWTLQEIVSGTS